MKKILLQLLCCFWTASAIAQCTIDSSQTVPGLYPTIPPNAQVGVYYNQDFTVVFPTETLGLDILSVQLDTIEGEVPGLSWICNSPFPNCTYYPNQSVYGCINISGIPQAAGLYPVTIRLIVDIQLVGIQNIAITLNNIVDPGILNNPGFQVTPPSGCAPVIVSITSNVPGQIGYHWDFGNGGTSILENPDPVSYNTGGTYIIYRDIIPQPGSRFYLMGVTVNSIPDAYNDGGLDVADLYIKVKDTNNVNMVPEVIVNNQISNVHFDIDTLYLNNENYTIEVWDDDPFIGAPDDSLGVISFTGWGTSGSATSTLTGASGILDVSFTITTTPLSPVTDSMIVTIYNTPPPPTILWNNDTLLTAPVNGFQYQWYLDSQLLPGDTLSFITQLVPGIYTIVITDINGCSSASDFSITRINKIEKSAFDLYPNPSTGIFQLNGIEHSECMIKVSDVHGREVFKSSLQSLPAKLDLSQLKNGVYFMQFEGKQVYNFPFYILH